MRRGEPGGIVAYAVRAYVEMSLPGLAPFEALRIPPRFLPSSAPSPPLSPNALRAACAHVDEVLKLAGRAYVGRTNFPERRLLEHMAGAGRNKLFAVHWTDDRDEVAEMETSLIGRYQHLYKVENEALDARGRFGVPPYAVYVSWVWRTGVAQVQTIGGLSAKVVNAVPDQPGRSRFLRTELDRFEAAAAVR